MDRTPQRDATARREKMKHITELGLKHMEDKKVSTTLLGHEIELQDFVANVAGVVEWVEGYVKDAIKDIPYASIVMAGVSLVLPLLKNPSADEATNQNGFTYVISQMRYYDAMESLLLPEAMKSDLRNDLTTRLVDLYKLIIDFQLRSIIRFYRSRTKNFFRGAINYDGWEKRLVDIKKADAELNAKFETAMSGSSLEELRKLSQEAEDSRKILKKLVDKAQELVNVNHSQLTVMEDIKQLILDPQTRLCLQDLRTTDPRHDKTRIEDTKGGLLSDSYVWVLSNKEFKHWYNNEESQLLWIQGDPGKGKTMLLCGIINELGPSTKLEDPTSSTLLSYFFCQATDSRINNATAVLRGLIYMLIDQQPTLISHVQNRYNQAGKGLFEDVNAWQALSEIFNSIFEDLKPQNTYLVIDALDECITDLKLLLNFIAKKSLAFSRVKWIISSRNWPSINEGLNKATKKIGLSLELNKDTVSAAVGIYIVHKVAQLAVNKGYDIKTRNAVQNHLQSNANDTFLWVALVCKTLDETSRLSTLSKLNAFPSGLDELYKRMINQIHESDDAKLCKSILAIASSVYQPITFDELALFVNIPDGISDERFQAQIVSSCGSFLTLRKRTIFFVHQSAQDFILNKASSDIFPSGMNNVHYTIFSRSLQAMSKTLCRDIYSLKTPGFPIERVETPDLDPLTAVRYSCLYWIDHLHNCNDTQMVKRDLQDGGEVENFLSKKYLNWLEALSILRSMSNGLLSMIKLDCLFQVCRI
jgi:hypothetical protein